MNSKVMIFLYQEISRFRTFETILKLFEWTYTCTACAVNYWHLPVAPGFANAHKNLDR